MIVFVVFAVILLVVGSVYDWKYHSLPMWLLLIGGVGGVIGIFFAWQGEIRSITELWTALLLGVMGILLAYVTREQIGYGDGWILLIMGACLGVAQVVAALFWALAGVCIVSIFLLMSKKGNRSSQIPFVPFLCVGSLVTILGGG